MGRNSKHDVVVIERGGSGLLWLVVGGVVGAGLGLLFAPHTGKRTRELLGDKLGELKEKVLDELEGGDEGAGEDEDEGEGEAEAEIEEEMEAAVETPRRSARAELERRLARARARRRRELAEEDEEPVA